LEVGRVIGETIELAGVPTALRTDALEEAWHYAVSSPGKGTRSKLLVCSEAVARGGHGDADPRIDVALAGVEMFHIATLVHDDVMDASELRRGIASVPARYGAPLAAATGGLFFGRALRLFSRCGQGAVLVSVETAERICQGQMLELRALRDPSRTREAYLQVAASKTGGMFWLAARLGGMLGGGDRATQDALARYAERVGIAYQIIDDVLDLTAGPERTGTPLGSDLRNGVYTLPVIYALEEEPKLIGLLRSEAATETVIDGILDTRALMRASAEARSWMEDAKDAVRELPQSRGLLEIADDELAALGDGHDT
jgi:heptaprenyl diphosphate synthase